MLHVPSCPPYLLFYSKYAIGSLPPRAMSIFPGRLVVYVFFLLHQAWVDVCIACPAIPLCCRAVVVGVFFVFLGGRAVSSCVFHTPPVHLAVVDLFRIQMSDFTSIYTATE